MSSNLKGKHFLTKGKFQFSGIPPRKKRSEANLEFKKPVEKIDNALKPQIQGKEDHASKKKDNDWGFDDEIDWEETNATAKAVPPASKSSNVDNSSTQVSTSNITSLKSKNVDSSHVQPISAGFPKHNFNSTSSGGSNIPSMKNSAPFAPANSLTSNVSNTFIPEERKFTQERTVLKSPKPKTLAPQNIDLEYVGGWQTEEDELFNEISKENTIGTTQQKTIPEVEIKKSSPSTQVDSTWDKDNSWGDWNSDSIEIPPVLDMPGQIISAPVAIPPIPIEILPQKEQVVKYIGDQPGPFDSKFPKSPATKNISPAKEFAKIQKTEQSPDIKFKNTEKNQSNENWDIGDEGLFTHSPGKSEGSNKSPKLFREPIQIQSQMPNVLQVSPKKVSPSKVSPTKQPINSPDILNVTEVKSPSHSNAIVKKSPGSFSNMSPKAQKVNVSPKVEQSIGGAPQLKMSGNVSDSSQMMLTSAPGFLQTQPEISQPKSANSFHTSPVIPSKSPEVPFRKESTTYQATALQYATHETGQYIHPNGVNEQVNNPELHPDYNYHSQSYAHTSAGEISPAAFNPPQYSQEIVGSNSQNFEASNYNPEYDTLQSHGDNNLALDGVMANQENVNYGDEQSQQYNEWANNQVTNEEYTNYGNYHEQGYDPENHGLGLDGYGSNVGFTDNQHLAYNHNAQSNFQTIENTTAHQQQSEYTNGQYQEYSQKLEASDIQYDPIGQDVQYNYSESEQQQLYSAYNEHSYNPETVTPADSSLHGYSEYEQQNVNQQSNEAANYSEIPADNQYQYATDNQYQADYYDRNQESYPYNENNAETNHSHQQGVAGYSQTAQLEHSQVGISEYTNQGYSYQDEGYSNEITEPSKPNQAGNQSEVNVVDDNNVRNDDYYPQDDFGLHLPTSGENCTTVDESHQHHPLDANMETQTQAQTFEVNQQYFTTPDFVESKQFSGLSHEKERPTEPIGDNASLNLNEHESYPLNGTGEQEEINSSQPLGHSFQSADTLASRGESFKTESVIVTYNTCHSCNKNNDADANFCAKCGTKLITKDPLFRDRGYGFSRISEFGKIFTSKVLRETSEKALPGNLLWHGLFGLTNQEYLRSFNLFKTDGPIFDYAQANLETLVQNISTYIETLQEEDSYLLTYFLLLMLQYNDTENVNSEAIKYFISVLIPQDFQQITPLDQILYNILCGYTNEAIEIAINYNIWEVALILAKYFNSDLYGKVVSSMLKGGIGKSQTSQIQASHSTSVMEVLLSVMADVDQNEIRELLVGQNEKFVPNWKLYLAALLSIRRDNHQAYFEVIGSILTETGLPKIGHLIELITFSFNFKVGLQRFKSKVSLLGADHVVNPYTYHNDVVAVQLTELLEAHIILNSQWHTTPFIKLQHYKLKLASQLGDLGVAEQANRYLESIASFTQYLAPDPEEDVEHFNSSLIDFKANFQKVDLNSLGVVGVTQAEHYTGYGYQETDMTIENAPGETTDGITDERRQSNFNHSQIIEDYHDGVPLNTNQAVYDNNPQYHISQEYQYSAESLNNAVGNEQIENYSLEPHRAEIYNNYSNQTQDSSSMVDNSGVENQEFFPPPSDLNPIQHYHGEQTNESKPPLPPPTPNFSKSHLSPTISSETKLSPKMVPPPLGKPVVNEDEDLGFGNSKPKAKESEKIVDTIKTAEEPKEEAKKEVVKKTSTSFFSRIFSPFSSKKAEDQPTVYKAHLPTGNPIVYDPVTKKWVKKDQLGKAETKEDSAPPPPPILPSSTPSSEAGVPLPAKATESPMATPSGITPPISRSSTKKRGTRSKYVDIINPNSAESSPIVQSFVPQFDSPLGEPKILSPRTGVPGPKMMDIARLSSVSKDQVGNNTSESKLPSTPAKGSPLIANLHQSTTISPPTVPALAIGNQKAPAQSPSTGATMHPVQPRPPSANLQGRPLTNPTLRNPTRPQSQYPPDMSTQQILSRPSSTNSLGFDKPGRQGAPPADL
ncbi:vesicle coat component [Boothiomyces sp. JEL0866]|nr:vesicle coat component [Boothiomyces sp. JEL0866]